MYSRKVLKCDNQGLMQDLVNNFLAEKPKKTVYGNFRIEPDGIYYRTKNKEEVYTEDFATLKNKLEKGLIELDAENLAKINKGERCHITYFEFNENVVAKKIKREGEPDLILGNSSILSLIGSYSAYGKFTPNTRETLVQKILATQVRMLPFSAFEESGLDLNKIRILDQSGAETIKRKVLVPRHYRNNYKDTFRIEKVHFTGASLFEVDGKYFLLDIDRNEIKHKIFNPFVVQLAKKAKTIVEAYEDLKPQLVKDAERKGKKVLRQGEWFFIPTKAPKMPRVDENMAIKILASGNRWNTTLLDTILGKNKVKALAKKLNKITAAVPRAISLKAGENRPNNAQLGLTVKGVTYVSGTIQHTGREHADLKLKGWYIAVPNTATKSVTITGDID